MCTDVVVLIDREQGGRSHLKANGLTLHAAITLSELLKVRSGRCLRAVPCCILPRLLEWAACVTAPACDEVSR